MKKIAALIIAGMLMFPWAASAQQWTQNPFTPFSSPDFRGIETPGIAPYTPPSIPDSGGDFFNNYMRQLRRERERQDRESQQWQMYRDDNAPRDFNCFYGRGHVNDCPM